MRIRITIILLGLILFNLDVIAQSNLKLLKISTEKPSKLDSNTVFAPSIKCFPSQNFLFKNNEISFFEPTYDSVVVSFRVLSFPLDKEFKKYDLSKKDTVIEFYKPIFENVESREELFASPGIDKSGVLSRGISFGNRQDVFVNSNLNLQMQGELGDGIKLNAVISDQNIPFQPEGNTQQIQEFDQIFINLDHKNWGINAGDILLEKQDAFYMKYFKKVQGVNFEVKNKTDSSQHKSYVAASLAKGKFNSVLLEQIEGVQGPYRLEGISGEKFIIVVANSEKIFLDGKLLKRGFDFDYVIDYNTSEIIFMNSLVITKFSRIRVDFEYTERNFSRSVYAFGHQQSNDKISIGFNYFNEKDNKRQPINNTFSLSELELLESIGDSIQYAYLSSVNPFQPEDVDKILYAKLDSNGFEIYKYSNSPFKDTLFTVDFSEVGAGRGDYLQEISTVNGRVYKWVGKNQGSFLPIRILPTPNKRQMIALNADFNLNKNTKIVSEFVMSDKDVNLFSDSSNRDNIGFAMRLGIENNHFKLSNKWIMNTSFDYQLQEKKFNALDRIRDVDFERDWNAIDTEKATENLLNATIHLKDTSGNNLIYKASYRNKKELVNGLQHTLEFDNKFFSFLRVRGKSFLMDNENQIQTAQWRRVFINPELNIKNRSKIGYEFNFDKNKVTQGNTILRPLMNYDEQVFYIKSGDSTQGSLLIEHRLRKDYLPVANQLDWFNSNWNDNANTTSITYSGNIGDNNNFKITSSYRNLQTKDTLAVNQDEQNILGRLDWNSNSFSKHISSNVTYTVNSSRELIREVQFIPVLQSQGTHIWIDYNSDGVKDLDEFQQTIEGVTVGSDTLYAKFLFPTSQYTPAFTHNFNYRFNAKAPVKWRKKKGIKYFASKFDNTSFLIIDKKTTNPDINSRLNPFSSSLELDGLNSEVLSLTRNIRSTLFFDKTNPKHAFDLTRIEQGAKQLLNYGQDGRFLQEWKFNSRFLVKNKVTLKFTGIQSLRQSKSTYLTSREYDINTNQFNNQAAIQPNKSVRFTLGYDLKLKNGIADTSRPTSVANEINFETKIRQLSERTITASFKYVNIQFQNGNDRTPIGYEMLEALQPGNNFLWNLNIQQRMSNGLNLTITYEGRKSATSQMVHTGSMQVSALF